MTALIAPMPPAPESDRLWFTVYCRACGTKECMSRDEHDPLLTERCDEHNALLHSEQYRSESGTILQSGEQDTAMPRGFPRPRLDVAGYETGPTPYVAASARNPGSLDYDRSYETIDGFLCQVCGLAVGDERCGVATALPARAGADPGTLTIEEDHGLTHEKCAQLTVAWCPAFTGNPAFTGMAMWLVDTASLRTVWPQLGKTLTLGMLTGVTRIEPPAGARRPWLASA